MLLLAALVPSATAQTPAAPRTADTAQRVAGPLNAQAPNPVLYLPRNYYGPGQPITVRINSPTPLDLMIVDFFGSATARRSPKPGTGDVDITLSFPSSFADPNTFLLLAVPPGAGPADFVGTPVVLSIRVAPPRSATPGPLVIRLEPLRYARLRTTQGDMRVAFYYDVAPNTVGVVQRLMAEGLYNDSPFFRIEPGFVVQTGDPRGNGTGGPGFMIDAEFSERQHLEGVLSLARLTDPNEAPGLLPRAEFANSAGSQFFICLDYKTCQQLDRRYTAFGRVVDGLDVLRAIAATPTDPQTARPKGTPPRILSADVIDVTPGDNPYSRVEASTTQPAAVNRVPSASDPDAAPLAPNAPGSTSGGPTADPNRAPPLAVPPR